jgi:hypothetical protein
MLDVIDLTAEFRRSIEMGSQSHAGLAREWNAAKDDAPLRMHLFSLKSHIRSTIRSKREK